MNTTITAYSTALYSTWIFIEELGLLLDAGDGVSAGLIQKSGKVKNIFITHADRDHLTGLFQFNQLNARKGLPIIHYPKHCGSFPFLQEFTSKFDPHVDGAIWKPIQAKEQISIHKDYRITAIRNGHVRAADGISKSLSYQIDYIKRKLKPQFLSLSGNEIRDLIKEKGNDYITEIIVENYLNYSGDSPVEKYERWDNSNILIHEATFLGGDMDRKINPHGNKHSTLPEVMEMIANIKVNKLILNHFSPRYSPAQIDTEIMRLIKKYGIKIPVYRILPGEIHRDIINSNPVNG